MTRICSGLIRNTIGITSTTFCACWTASCGNEQWEFDAEGYMQRREASINDVPIDWPLGPRPADHPGLAGVR